jgi:CRP-like cAMP-binding protein
MNQAAQSRRDALRQAAPFARLGDAECDALLTVLRARQGLPGDVLFAQGDPGDSLMVIAEGALIARVRRPSGLEVELARFGPGDIVGELAVVDAQPRSATLVAAERTIVYTLSREGLVTLAHMAPTVATTLLRSITATAVRRLRWTTNQIVRQLDGAQHLDAAPRSGHVAPPRAPEPAPRPPEPPPPPRAEPPRSHAAPLLELEVPPGAPELVALDPPEQIPLDPPELIPLEPEAPAALGADGLPEIPELDLPRRRP